jgi:hypothetical protein
MKTRKVKIRSWDSMVKEYSIDEEGDIFNAEEYQYFTQYMRVICGKTIVIEYIEDDYIYCIDGVHVEICDWMIDKEPTIEEKTIEDFPLVTYKSCGKWFSCRYILTEETGLYLIRTSYGVKYVEEIRLKYEHPVDIDDLKRRARLV